MKMVEPFEVEDVSEWLQTDVEAVGDSPAFWIRRAEKEPAWLFKPRDVWVNHEGGNDGAERLATEFGRLLDIPCAEARLAVRAGVRGTISLDVRHTGWELQNGAVLLQASDPGFIVQSKDRVGHHLTAIAHALDGILPPEGYDYLESAVDAFAGYLVLDALVANTDRHEENWAVLRSVVAGQPDRLSPSWDHGSALGHRLDEGFTGRKDPVRWAHAGMAARFDAATDGRLSLVQLAIKAMTFTSHPGEHRWWTALESLDDRVIADTLARAELSEARHNFLMAVISTNRRRLLDERDDRL